MKHLVNFFLRPRGLRAIGLLLGLLLGGQPAVWAQNAVPLGGGSYAEYPPQWEAAKPYYPGTDAWGDLSQTLMHRKWYVVDTTTRALPTTDWWTNLIDQKYSDDLWAYPGVANAEDYGLYVEFPKRWQVAGDGNTAKLVSRSRVTIGGVDFAPESALARRWGAWTLDWIMQDATDHSRQFAVTIGHGLPFTWVETTKVTPTISVDSATFFNDAGAPVTLPFTGDHFGIQTKGDAYGIFAPAGTRFTVSTAGGTSTITATFTGPNGYVVVGTMPAATDLATFNTYAYTVPRDSKVSWVYDEPSAEMRTTWELVNVNLRGGAQLNQIQGWLPHSYKKTTRGFAFNGMEFATPRGVLKCAVGNRFTVTYNFNGLLPGFPVPEVQAGIRHPYRPAVMQELIDNYKSVQGYRDDTYWGGKNVLDYARYMQLAAQTGDTEAYKVLHAQLRKVLEDWFTYTPGESAHFYSLYPNIGSFLGHRTRDNGNPGVELMQDHAFCYGYHVYAAAILFMYDEEFKTKYRDIAKTLTLDYANYNRNDKRFAYFRSFDPWAGHSYSGGLGDANGNGEESSSEGMQAWGAMYMLGEVLGDKPLRDAGIFGYAQEAQGVAEYWFDRSHIPANGGQGNYDYSKWQRPYNSNLSSSGIGWWTWFSGDPFWMHAIQWIPVSPLMKYLSEDVPFAAWDWNSMWTTKQGGGWDSDMGNKGDLTAMGLGYFQISNPDSAAAIYDNLWDTNRDGAHAQDNNAFIYYYIHSHRTLGEIQWNQHTNLPSSTVYFNARLNQTTVVVYNPNATETVVDVYHNGTSTPYASFTAPAKKLIAYKFDARLTTIKVTAPTKTVPPGQTLQLTAQGYDQYGARVTTPVTWSVATGGGSISPAGVLTAGAVTGTYLVSATAGTIVGTYTVRVNATSVLTTIALTPSIRRAEIGQTYPLTATGLDQYGDTLAIAPTWTLSGGGTVSSTGLFTPTTPSGSVILQATANGVTGSLSMPVSYPLVNLAVGKTATASTTNPANPINQINDGSLTTRWESANQNQQWVVIDLGGIFDLDQVVLNWEPAFASSYNLQLSTDGTTYAPLYTQAAGTGGREAISVTGTGRYLKLNMLQRGSNWQYSLYEIEAYGLPQRTGPPVLASLIVAPSLVTMKDTARQQFTAQAYDQYGALMPVTPTWQVVGRGTISPTGLYRPTSGSMYLQTTFNVVAHAGGTQAQATVAVEEIPRLMKLDIQPLSTTANYIEMAIGTSKQLTYEAKNQFGVSFDGPLTWVASGGGTVTQTGNFTANQLGNWLVIGRNGNLSDTAYIAVKPFGDVNLATYKPVKTSSVENGAAGVVGAMAVDRDRTITRWASTQQVDPQWLSVDLQAAYQLNKVVIYWEGAYASSYNVEVSLDGTPGSWTQVAAVSGAAADGGQDVLTFPETPGRYVRMNGYTRHTGYGYSIYEFEVYGTGLSNIAAPLPVELTAFAATAEGAAAVRLAWATASEKNNARFEVERSADGQTFGRIGSVAGAGNSTAPHTYGLLDAKLPANPTVLYYRLRQVDLSGPATYSPVRAVTWPGHSSAGLTLAPNPARTSTTLAGAEAGAKVQVLDALGRIVATATADATGTATLTLPPGLPGSVYVVRAGTRAARLVVE